MQRRETHKKQISTVSCSPFVPPLSPLCQTGLHIIAIEIRRELERLSQTARPDSINQRVLKTCANQLCGVLQHLCTLKVFQCYRKHPAVFQWLRVDIRPVALTTHIMKAHLRPLVCPSQYSLQFSYQLMVAVKENNILLSGQFHVLWLRQCSQYHPDLLRAKLENM